VADAVVDASWVRFVAALGAGPAPPPLSSVSCWLTSTLAPVASSPFEFRFPSKIALLVGLAAVPCLAQGTGNVHDEIELTRQEVRANRQDIIRRLLDLTEQQSQAFWPIYRSYQEESAKLGDQRVVLIETYLKSSATLTDEQAKELLSQSFKLREKQLSLQKKYVGKYQKVIPGVKVARLYQIDNVLDAVIQANLHAQMPMAGDTTAQ